MGISSGLGGTVGAVPAGAVMPFAGASAPAGWLLCFGQNVSRSQYGELFAVLGTTYGSGDGSTTFGLPDLRGRVVAGQDDMGGTSANRLTNPAATTGGIDGDVLGGTGGSETHTLTTTQMPAHNHTGSISPSTVYTTSSPFWGTTYGAPEIGVNYAFNTSVTINNTGGGAAHNNVQPTMVLNYIIKA